MGPKGARAGPAAGTGGPGGCRTGPNGPGEADAGEAEPGACPGTAVDAGPWNGPAPDGNGPGGWAAPGRSGEWETGIVRAPAGPGRVEPPGTFGAGECEPAATLLGRGTGLGVVPAGRRRTRPGSGPDRRCLAPSGQRRRTGRRRGRGHKRHQDVPGFLERLHVPDKAILVHLLGGEHQLGICGLQAVQEGSFQVLARHAQVWQTQRL
jgi:hypothetical protein